jgi:hypothetical protein
MSCVTLFGKPMAMTTTQLVRIDHEDAPFWQVERKAEHKPLHMSWVVVTDENGKRQLRMHWVAIESC